MSNRGLFYSQLDVFAEGPFEGNQLAVFHDATGLSTQQMQALARETNLSETTFILPRDPEEEAAHGVDVRIFTTQEELPFAGHPTLGTASWLYWNHAKLRGAGEIKLRLKAGTVPVRFRFPKTGERGVYGEMTQPEGRLLREVPRQEFAKVFGITQSMLHPWLPVQVFSTGMPFCVVPLVSLQTLGALRLNPETAEHFAKEIGARFFYLIAPTGREDVWRARMHFYNGEDPATGSACGCAISYLVWNRAIEGGEATTFLQGVEMKRPSKLTARAQIGPEEKLVDVRVGGRTMLAASGQFFLP